MPLFRRRRAPSTPAALSLSDALLEGTDMLEQTAVAHADRWGLGTADRWDLDGAAGLLRWTFADRLAEAPVQVLGTHDPVAASWRWAWADAAVPSRLCSASREVRAIGERHGHASLTTPALDGVSAEQAADLTAIAFRITRATGFYRGPVCRSHLHLTFGPVVLTSGRRSETFSLDVG